MVYMIFEKVFRFNIFKHKIFSYVAQVILKEQTNLTWEMFLIFKCSKTIENLSVNNAVKGLFVPEHCKNKCRLSLRL